VNWGRENYLQKLFVFLGIILFILNGCNNENNHASNKKNKDTSIVDYEYLSINELYSDEINQWLSKAISSEEESLYSLESKDGNTYVYAKGHKKAKVSYLHEDIEGKIRRNLKVTLLKGNSSETVFLKVSYNSDYCCDFVIIGDAEKENDFNANDLISD
jgi:hypothetical protein